MIHTPTPFPMIAQRLFNRPLMILPSKAELVAAAIASRMGIARLDVIERNGVRTLGAPEFEALIGSSSGQAAEYRGYEVVDGVAVILIRDGEVLEDRMRVERVEMSDVLEAARLQMGLERLDQIKLAVLERGGKISVIPRTAAA